jgi:hypothetical protein
MDKGYSKPFAEMKVQIASKTKGCWASLWPGKPKLKWGTISHPDRQKWKTLAISVNIEDVEQQTFSNTGVGVLFGMITLRIFYFVSCGAGDGSRVLQCWAAALLLSYTPAMARLPWRAVGNSW